MQPLLEFMLQKAHQSESTNPGPKSEPDLTPRAAFSVPPILPLSSTPLSATFSDSITPLSSAGTAPYKASQPEELLFDGSVDDPFMSSFGDIAWQGLFRESSGGSSSYGFRADMGTIDNAVATSLDGGDMPMLDDSWNRFMRKFLFLFVFHS